MSKSHREVLLESLPSPKAEAKTSSTLLGAGIAIFGGVLCVGGFFALVLMIFRNVELSLWSVIALSGPFVGGMILVGTGAHIMSGELVRAAWRDIATSVRSILRRNGNGVSGGSQ